MKVILLVKVEQLGKKHDVVTVARGYAMNYLLPQKLAKAATEGELRRIELIRGREDKKRALILAKADELMKELASVGTLTLSSKVTKKDTLFAAVTERQVCEALVAEHKIELPQDMVHFTHIKQLGNYTAEIQVGENTFSLPIAVVAAK